MRNESHFQFKNRLVADLSWCIGSPPLLDENALPGIFLYNESTCDQLWEDHLDWLHWLDQHPELLEGLVEQRTHGFLGRKFEALLRFWFSHSPVFKVYDQHIVLSSEGRTQTELDFVVEDKQQEALYHLEVACKFYLGRPPSRPWENWVGPNPEDRLDIKTARFRKQFSSEIEQALRAYTQFPSQPKPAIFFKGFFFLPMNGSGHVLPKNACSRALVGWYITLASVHQLEGELKQWFVLPKDYWMAPYQGREEWPVLSGNELIDYAQHHFTIRKNALLVIQTWEEENHYKEISRGFIVCD